MLKPTGQKGSRKAEVSTDKKSSIRINQQYLKQDQKQNKSKIEKIISSKHNQSKKNNQTEKQSSKNNQSENNNQTQKQSGKHNESKNNNQTDKQTETNKDNFSTKFPNKQVGIKNGISLLKKALCFIQNAQIDTKVQTLIIKYLSLYLSLLNSFKNDKDESICRQIDFKNRSIKQTEAQSARQTAKQTIQPKQQRMSANDKITLPKINAKTQVLTQFFQKKSSKTKVNNELKPNQVKNIQSKQLSKIKQRLLTVTQQNKTKAENQRNNIVQSQKKKDKRTQKSIDNLNQSLAQKSRLYGQISTGKRCTQSQKINNLSNAKQDPPKLKSTNLVSGSTKYVFRGKDGKTKMKEVTLEQIVKGLKSKIQGHLSLIQTLNCKVKQFEKKSCLSNSKAIQEKFSLQCFQSQQNKSEQLIYRQILYVDEEQLQKRQKYEEPVQHEVNWQICVLRSQLEQRQAQISSLWLLLSQPNTLGGKSTQYWLKNEFESVKFGNLV